jgi:hypothetical protein
MGAQAGWRRAERSVDTVGRQRRVLHSDLDSDAALVLRHGKHGHNQRNRNSDVYIGSDGAHPNDAGYLNVMAWLLDGLKTIVVPNLRR